MIAKQRVVITGTTGQLGRALLEAQADQWDITPINRQDTDLLDWQTVRERIIAVDPDLVIHSAAVTDVDGCERDPSMAYLGNALATRHVAQAAALAAAQLVYVSTNFVFDGSKVGPYHEFDVPNPISAYGSSKLAGEREALAATDRLFIVRTAMVFAAEGRNFVLTMRRLMAERERLTVVSDQSGNPTYAADLAEAIVALTERGPFGTYHVTNTGSASWFDWAREIAEIDDRSTVIEPIPAVEYLRDATPPTNGELTSLTLGRLGIKLPDWRDALRRCMSA